MARPARITRAVPPSGVFSVITDYRRSLDQGFTRHSAWDAIRHRNAYLHQPIKVLHAKQRSKARAAITFLRGLK